MIISAKKLFQYCKKGYHKPLLKIYITRKVKGPYLIVASSYYLMFSGAATSSGLLNSCVWALSKVLTITCSLCQDKTSIFYCQGWEVCQKNMQQNIGFCPNWLDPPFSPKVGIFTVNLPGKKGSVFCHFWLIWVRFW